MEPPRAQPSPHATGRAITLPSPSSKRATRLSSNRISVKCCHGIQRTSRFRRTSKSKGHSSRRNFAGSRVFEIVGRKAEGGQRQVSGWRSCPRLDRILRQEYGKADARG